AALAAGSAGATAAVATGAATGATAAAIAPVSAVAARVRSAPSTVAAPGTWRAASRHQGSSGENRPGEEPETISRRRLGRHGTPLVEAYIFSILNTLPSAYSEKYISPWPSRPKLLSLAVWMPV